MGKWADYTQTRPPNSGIEVSLGYVNNKRFSLINNGGVLVSKIFSRNVSKIYYVERSYISPYIVNGLYTAISPPIAHIDLSLTDAGVILSGIYSISHPLVEITEYHWTLIGDYEIIDGNLSSPELEVAFLSDGEAILIVRDSAGLESTPMHVFVETIQGDNTMKTTLTSVQKTLSLEDTASILETGSGTVLYNHETAALEVGSNIRETGRIYTEGNFLMCNGQRIFLNGVNTPWLNWNEFGSGTLDISWWTEEFARLVSRGINAIRVWIVCSSENLGVVANADGTIAPPTAQFWADVDVVLIRLVDKFHLTNCPITC